MKRKRGIENAEELPQPTKIRKFLSDLPAPLYPNQSNLPTFKKPHNLRKLLSNGFMNYENSRKVRYPLKFISNSSSSGDEKTKQQLKYFQIFGVNWMISKYNTKMQGAILSDEMGLGKTVQACVFISELFKSEYINKSKKKYLICCPLNLFDQWKNELIKWFPWGDNINNDINEELKIIIFHGLNINEKILKGDWNFLITNYFTIRDLQKKDKKMGRYFFDLNWEVSIFDEGHKLKNPEALIHLECCKIKSDFKILLTGTPFQIDIDEVWSLLNFTFGEKEIQEKEKFIEKYGIIDGNNKSCQNIKSFQNEILGRYILMRKKEDVLTDDDISKKYEIVISLNLCEIQKMLYRATVERNLKFLIGDPNNKEEGKKIRKIGRISSSLTSIVAGLKDICLHPYLLRGAEQLIISKALEKSKVEHFNEREINELLIASSSKMIVLDKILKKYIIENGEKCLLFTGRIDLIPIFEDYLIFRNYKYCVIQGSTPTQERRRMLKDFQSKPDKKVFILSTKAGNLGLNLTSASVVILFDQHFNPFHDKQASDRSHRIGQTRVFKITTKNTVESNLMTKTGKRLFNESVLFEKGSLNKYSNKETMKLLKKGVYEMYKRDNIDESNLKDLDINQIIDSQKNNKSSYLDFKESKENAFLKLNDKDFWRKLFPNFVDVEILEEKYKKSMIFSQAESNKFLIDLDKVISKTNHQNTSIDEKTRLLNLLYTIIKRNSKLKISESKYSILKSVILSLENREKRKVRKRRFSVDDLYDDDDQKDDDKKDEDYFPSQFSQSYNNRDTSDDFVIPSDFAPVKDKNLLFSIRNTPHPRFFKMISETPKKSPQSQSQVIVID